MINLTSFEKIWNIVGPQQNRTKLTKERMENLYNIATTIISNNIDGDFVEVGTWKGGACALLGKLCEDENKGRKVWACDSFEGMSEPNKILDINNCPSTMMLRNFNLEDFKYTCFNMMELKQETFNIQKGWVEATLSWVSQLINKIAILRIDVDWHDPTKITLDNLYDKVINNGYIICDDYGYWKGAKKAVDDFRQQKNISSSIIMTKEIDPDAIQTECYWIKQ